MPCIKLLDESIAQKIAAGEVVERPYSVVKELIENSVDAGSTFITVEIKEGGIDSIRVTDNGCGIPADEVELAFLRHATSKIQSLDDLYNIQHMGFRGEALYSIAAVSKLELTTKPAQQASGTRLLIHGGNKISLDDYGCPDGTTIIVSNIFYNTPARLKFLNKPGIEAGAVGSSVVRHILANPGISVKFISNDKVIYHSTGDGNLKNAIYTIFGKEIAKGLIPVEDDNSKIAISGYLFAPADAFSNRSRQMLMVNQRPVNNFTVSAIIERIYGGLTDSKRFPGYVINISLPPADVDVNVHPNKLQVRFANEYEVRQAVEFAASKAIEKFKNQPVIWAFTKEAKEETNSSEGYGESDNKPPEAENEMQSPIIAKSSIPTIQCPPQAKAVEPVQKNNIYSPVETISETVGRYTESLRATMGMAPAGLPKAGEAQLTLMQRPSIANTTIEQANYKNAEIPVKSSARIIGQVFDTYALLEADEKLLIIDQHAAHERLLFEKYTGRLKNAEPCKQKLLIPQVINVSYEVKQSLDENIDLLESIGFEIEEYGRLSYQIRAVPFILGQPQVQDFIFEILEILSDDRSLHTEELKKEKLMSMACKKAVKAGDKLTESELATLTELIAAEDIPLTCPHGRPFVIILDKKSMDKQFRRIK